MGSFTGYDFEQYYIRGSINRGSWGYLQLKYRKLTENPLLPGLRYLNIIQAIDICGIMQMRPIIAICYS